jgi:3-(methylthio)propionyl---CoA ligase
MLGLMQEQPLLISSLIEHAARHHGAVEIVSRRVEGDIHRTTYAQVAARSRQLANALCAWRLEPFGRVASLAWNGYRHFEMYFGVSGSGHVLHTINPRLVPEQIAWIVDHAQDQALFFDMTFWPMVQKLMPMCPTVKHWVALCDDDYLKAQAPEAEAMGVKAYEALLAAQPSAYVWPEFDERSASSMCYTSGTTGHPKAALYSHRSTILHAYGAALPDVMCMSARDSVLPVVPMFHVNSWGIPYSACAVGCKLVFPGPALDGASVYQLLDTEQVTFAAGVPTVWQMLLKHLQDHQLELAHLQRTVIGGSACPPAMIEAFESRYQVEVLHAWGMTELSPLGTVCRLKNHQLALEPPAQNAIRLKQGRAVFGIDMKIVDPAGQELPWDGESAGELMVKGPWVIRNYYQMDDQAALVQGWFPTGDLATIDPDGFMQITDRAKDVIKSGGEWISSIDIENIAMAHPAVMMAACIGMPHPKWDERPIVVVVKRDGVALTREALLAFYDGKVAKWQVPDDVVFVDSIALGATGKMQKMKIRDQLAGYQLPDLRS